MLLFLNSYYIMRLQKFRRNCMEEKLKKLLENSYTPYYKYPVASVIVMKDGTEFSGLM